MKKIALFALAALCVTAVKATTLSWTAHGWTNFSSTEMAVILYNGDIATAKTFVNEAYPDQNTVTTADGTDDVRINDIKKRSDNSPWVPEGGVKSYVGSNRKGESWGEFSASNATSGSLTVFGSNYSVIEKAAWGGVATIIFFDGQTTNAHYYELTKEQVQMLVTGKDANGKDITELEVNVGVVPEPTALALLALGVAGLALKRKHA